MNNIKLSDLTLVGWLLALVTGGIIGVLSFFTVSLLPDDTGGLLYDILASLLGLLAFIPCILGFIFFVASAAILKALGLPVVKRPPESELTRILRKKGIL